MNIFSVFTLCGGLAFFLFGMNVMSQSLEKVAGGKLETTLRQFTSNRFFALIMGALITIAIQSSSAMTVMLVGLVNSGIMELSQTVGVIMGADIGTTLTGWILSLTGIQSDNIWVSLLKPENFSPIFALIGIVINMMSKKQRTKDIGTILVGFAVLMYGMELMKNAVEPLSDSPKFEELLVKFSNPVVALLIGAVFTGIIQSSAASVGILQALALTGAISYRMAIPIIMGLNIGTCMTAILSSIGVNRNAKRVAIVHVTIKIIGAIVWLTVFCVVTSIVDFEQIDQPISVFGIAVVHSIFNLATIAMLLPFCNPLVKLAMKILPEPQKKESEQKEVLLDQRLLNNPPMAVSRCVDLTAQMAEKAKEAMEMSLDMIFHYDESTVEEITKREQWLDTLEDELGTFLLNISAKELNEADSKSISQMMHAISDFERIGDHAINISEIGKEMLNAQLTFSEEAKTEYDIIASALREIMGITYQAFCSHDPRMALSVEPLEEVIDKLTEKLKDRHIARLRAGKCSPELGIFFSDLLIYIERISDHCSAIAASQIQISNASYATHDYLNDLREDRTPDFQASYKRYKKKYKLPKLEELTEQ